MATVAQLATDVKRIFGDESGTFLEDADLLRWFNQAQLDIARKTDHLTSVASATLDVVANGNILNVPNVLSIDKLYINKEELNYVTDFYINENDKIDVQPSTYAVIAKTSSVDIIFSSTTQNSKYVLYYTRLPVVLLTQNDSLTVPEQYQDTLIKFVLARAKEMEEDYNAAAVFQSEYDRQILHTRSDVAFASHAMYPTINLLDND